MAIGEIYNMRIHHDDVISPILRYPDPFDRRAQPRGLKAQEELAWYMNGLNSEAGKSTRKLAARKARMARARRAGRHRLTVRCV